MRQWYYCDICKAYTKSPDLVCSGCDNPIDTERWNKSGTLVASPFDLSKLEEKTLQELERNSKWWRRIFSKLVPRRKNKVSWEKSDWKVLHSNEVDK